MDNEKIAIIIEARMESKRLPGKVLKKINNITVIEHIINRCKKVKKIDSIIVATTTKKSDDVILEITNKLGVKNYRGSENDVLGRVLEAAEKNQIDIIIEITADNPLVDPEMIEEVIEEQEKYKNEYEYYANDINKNIPIGLNVRLFSTKLLKKISKLTNHPVDREHVVNYIMQRKDKFRIKEVKTKIDFDNSKNYRFTMDTIEDYKLIEKIYYSLYSENKIFTTNEVINYIQQNPEILKINEQIKQLEYKYE